MSMDNIAELIRKDPFPVFRISPDLELLIPSNKDCILSTLKKYDLYKDDLIYRGTNVPDYESILKNGTDRVDSDHDYFSSSYDLANRILIKLGHKPEDFFYGTPEENLGEVCNTGDPLDYALFHGDDTPVLIIYNPDFVIEDFKYHQPDLYFFKDKQKKKDAVVALFIWE